MTNSGLKKTKSSKFYCMEVIKWASSEYSDIKQDGHQPPAAVTLLRENNVPFKGMVANIDTKINQLKIKCVSMAATKSTTVIL